MGMLKSSEIFVELSGLSRILGKATGYPVPTCRHGYCCYSL